MFGPAANVFLISPFAPFFVGMPFLFPNGLNLPRAAHAVVPAATALYFLGIQSHALKDVLTDLRPALKWTNRGP